MGKCFYSLACSIVKRWGLPDTKKLTVLIAGISLSQGEVFTRWGRNDCPSTSTTLYSGEVTSGASTLSGGSQFLCLPSSNLQWLTYTTFDTGKCANWHQSTLRSMKAKYTVSNESRWQKWSSVWVRLFGRAVAVYHYQTCLMASDLTCSVFVWQHTVGCTESTMI